MMACHIDLTPGAARRGVGTGRALWPDVPPIVVCPGSLRPGLDMVRVRPDASPRPVPPGTWCLYLGHADGMAIVLPRGGDGPVPVAPWAIDEPERLPCDSVDPHEFEDGWAFGRAAHAHEIAVSERAVGNVPDAYGRGVVKGFDDRLESRAWRPGSCAPYNEVVRDLAARYPEEHYAPTLRRLRTHMAREADAA